MSGSIPGTLLSWLTPSQPTVFIPALITFISSYYSLAPYYATERQRSWILTALCSAIMTAASIPFVWDYVAGGWTVQAVRTSVALAPTANSFFQAYLVADLAMGALHYRKQVNLLSGWVHHSLYIFVVEIALRRDWAHIFSLCASMELPTFILAVGTLHPALRSDVLFATSFFATRIALHAALLFAYFSPANRKALLGGSFAPAGILAAAFALHAMWFSNCVKGNLRRWKARASGGMIAGIAKASVEGVQAKAEADVGVKTLELRSLEIRMEKIALPVSSSSSTLRQIPASSSAPSRSSFTPSSSSSSDARPSPTTSSHSILPPSMSSPSAAPGPATPARPWHFTRRNSLDRAVAAFQALQAQRLRDATLHALQSANAKLPTRDELERARRSVYARVASRLPAREVLMDYVGLNPRGREVAVY